MTSADKHQLKPLLTRALAGDAVAWNELFREIRKYLHAEARKVLGPEAQGQLDHSDVVQSALRRIWERIGEQIPDAPEDADVRRFLVWIKRIVRNRSYDQWRKILAHRVAATGSGLEDIAERRPMDRALQRDRVAVEVAAAMARLSERHRQVIELFWFDQLADKEISARLGCSVEAVRVLRFRALRKLCSPRLQSLLEDGYEGRC
jgi:RNA polymerase sigma factor (sigma-70 family)